MHLNNAGAALPPRIVVDTVIDHLRAEELRGGYEAEADAADRLTRVYDSIATLIGARRDEIALVENATRAWETAFSGFRFTPGQKILTAQSEYASNSVALHRTAAQTGVVIETVADTSAGVVDVEDLRRRLDSGGVALVAVAHLPTHNGLINPAAQIGAACRAARVPFLLDACQSVGQLPLDVTELGCDILAGTGRKWLRGPRGTGFLYVARSCDIQPPLVDLRAIEWPDPEAAPDSYAIRRDARRFELWESNIAARLGLGAAVDYALSLGIASIAARVQSLATLLRDELRARPGCSVLDVGEPRSGQSGIVTFSVAGVPATEVVARVAERGVSINMASAAAARYDRPGVRLEPVARASPHYYNTEDELARLLAVLPAPRAV